MARIPETEIERLKNEVSVQRLIESAGIELKKSGKDFIGLCPFHEDATPSLVVTPTKNLWHCFGCGAAGGPIDWIIKKNGVSFRHAVELLREGMPSSSAAEPLKQSRVRLLPAPVAFDADKQALLNQTIGYYHATLQQSPEALAYLQERGLDHPELIDHFLLGYANRTLGLRLPAKQCKAGDEIRTRLQEIGIYRESGHEHFNGSLIVPVIDAQGNVTEVYGRKITDRLRKGTPDHLYLPGPHRGVWNEPALIASTEIILCEALIDALTFWCAGYRNVTASYGVEGFTDDHLAAFKTHGTRRVLIAYDRDDAGERGAAKLAERLQAQGIDCYRVQFPKGMDANEYALKVQPAEKSLGILLRKATWLGQGRAPQGDIESAPVPTPPTVNTPAPPMLPEHSSLAAIPDSATPAAAILPASPIPPSAPPDIPIDIKDNEITLTLSDRRYRVRGLAKNLSFDLLKINLLVSRGETFYVDMLDLYSAKQRASYITHAAIELQLKEAILKSDLGRVLMRLEQLQADTITKAMQPAAPLAVQMSDTERQAALALLQSPDLSSRILADLSACGLIGEDTNKFVGYLACISRKLDKPLGIVIQSSSAAGKTSLMDAVLAFVPAEDKVKYSAMTGQSLFYMGETNLKHKALAIVEEEGASRASYALKLLQSEGELTMASTGKDPNTGELVTQQYRVEGPVALLITTTARDVDEELMNRCLVLAVDESRDQTRAIHQLQRDRRTLDGLAVKRQKDALIVLHQNAQRLLRKIDVLNPYAQYLTFPDQTTRLRRDHEKYLTLIDSIAFLHQHQRPVNTDRRGNQVIEYIEVTTDDIATANRIAHEVLGRSLDELPPQTRRLLHAIDSYVADIAIEQDAARADILFSRRALREAINWGDTQLKIHLARLVELEYVVAYRTRTGGFDYELVYDVAGDSDKLRFPGLADIDTLTHLYDVSRSGQNGTRSGSGRPPVGMQSAPGRVINMKQEPAVMRDCAELLENGAKTHVLRAKENIPPIPKPAIVLTVATTAGA
jgi:DNA primase